MKPIKVTIGDNPEVDITRHVRAVEGLPGGSEIRRYADVLREAEKTIPKSLARRPRFRGFPIPWTVKMLPGGIPDFKEIDDQKRQRALTKRLCGLCGASLPKVVAFVGGPIAARQGQYFDPPMHEDCAVYAAKVCPHLALGKDYAASTKAELESGPVKMVPIMGQDVVIILTQEWRWEREFGYRVTDEAGRRTFRRGEEIK